MIKIKILRFPTTPEKRDDHLEKPLTKDPSFYPAPETIVEIPIVEEAFDEKVAG